jgi:uncharacterized membrane protein YfcA
MTRTFTALAVAAAVATAAVASPTAAHARWRHHHGFPVAPIVGGLAAGALLGAALAARPPYVGYAYVAPRCYIRSERIWDGWGWRVRRIEECY